MINPTLWAQLRKKHTTGIALIRKINEANDLSTLEAIYSEMRDKNDRYRFMRQESSPFRSIFQKEGTTSSWSKVIKALQQQAYLIARDKDFNVSSKEDEFLIKMFSEKQGRIGFRKPFLREYEKRKVTQLPELIPHR